MKNLNFKATVVLLAISLLGGCAGYVKSVDEQGNEQVSNKVKGGVIVGGIALLEGLLNKRGRTKILQRTLIGFGVGTGVGAVIDSQNETLAEEFRAAGIAAEARDGLVEGSFPVHFATGSANVSQVDMQTIAKIARIKNNNKHANSYATILAGYTDSTGSAQMNQKLSEHRASNVGLALRNQGVQGVMETVGYGETQPVATNKTAIGRAANRRVVFIFIPNQQQ